MRNHSAHVVVRNYYRTRPLITFRRKRKKRKHWEKVDPKNPVNRDRYQSFTFEGGTSVPDTVFEKMRRRLTGPNPADIGVVKKPKMRNEFYTTLAHRLAAHLVHRSRARGAPARFYRSLFGKTRRRPPRAFFYGDLFARCGGRRRGAPLWKVVFAKYTKAFFEAPLYPDADGYYGIDRMANILIKRKLAHAQYGRNAPRQQVLRRF